MLSNLVYTDKTLLIKLETSLKSPFLVFLHTESLATFDGNAAAAHNFNLHFPVRPCHNFVSRIVR